ncbi:MAG: phosphate ABC transporter ATP-binding protein [Firmicutes bacterium]|nr:phosphate ABC transporter ATP-binding protein [Bacillota bacterium]
MAVELKQVSKTKPVLLGDTVTPIEVIKDVSITVERGQVLALIGPSGAGKSTLLRMLNRLEDPSSGSILLEGSDIAQMDVRELRRRVGMVSQTPALLPGTVGDNIAYGPNLRGEHCHPQRYLELVNLEQDLLHRPASALSIGQQQRMCIARTLANRPDVLLLDEPTSALDQTSANTVMNLIGRLNRELSLTVILVTHLMEHAQLIATQVGLLVKGQLVETGPANQFFQEPETEIGRKFLRGELDNHGV